MSKELAFSFDVYPAKPIVMQVRLVGAPVVRSFTSYVEAVVLMRNWWLGTGQATEYRHVWSDGSVSAWEQLRECGGQGHGAVKP